MYPRLPAFRVAGSSGVYIPAATVRWHGGWEMSGKTFKKTGTSQT
jgi:hypothetical protein